MKELSQLTPILILGILPLFLLRWRLNLLALEEDEAKSLGIPIQRTRYILIILPHFVRQVRSPLQELLAGLVCLCPISRDY